MRRYSLVFLMFSLVLMIEACGRDEQSPLPTGPDLRFATDLERAQGDVVPFSYLVAFREAATEAPRAKSILQIQNSLQSMLQNTRMVNAHRSIARLNLTYPGRSFSQEFNLDAHPFVHSGLNVPDEFTHLTEVQFDDEASARRQLDKWYAAKKIVFAEPNFQRATKGETEDKLISAFKGNNSTPWIEQVSFIDAIEKISTLGVKAEPLVAVMDSGVDVLHPNLKDSIFLNEEGQNKQCNGDIYGCNTTIATKDVLGDGSVYPTGTGGFGETCPLSSGQCEHGTHVAGIIGGRNSTEFTGMCPYCKILVVKVVEVETKGGEESFPIKDSSILAGLAYISGFKSGGQPLVRVINASFGKFENSRSVELFIKALKTYGRGTLLVAAAGNEDTMKRQYPAGFDDVLAVSNVESDTNKPFKSTSSNFGMWVDIAAPGDGACGPSNGILSSVPGGGAECRAGTSMASPMVAGIAGLVLSQEPNLTASQLEARLIETSNPSKLYSDGINNAYRPDIKGAGLVPLLGSGVVNALTAIDPSLDTSPVIVSERPDAVRSGCGVIGSGAQGGMGFLFLFLSPAFFWVFNSLRGFVAKRRDR
ncbi:MAG: hypothetical protein EOP07_05560 [Proteobacteria bacterium]|nr:MAG: hypothetical protein EOP07_05560 [Pseudomonadota bacterium]